MKFLIFSLLFMSLSAVSVYKVDPGDIYYINHGMFQDDERVVVVRVDTSDSTVKVRTYNGDTKWVKASGLLTKQGNENENTGRNVGMGILGGLFLLDAATREKKNKSRY